MGEALNTILEQYGIYGVLIVMLFIFGYLIYNDRKNNWGNKIDKLGMKIDNTNDKIEILETKVDTRISAIETKVDNMPAITQKYENSVAKKNTLEIITKGWGGKLSKVLKYHCKNIGCDHIFLSTFHNGTVDIRGMHYCKFDILIDEFADALHWHPNDVDFQPLYKDENILAYGDLPVTMQHIDAVILNVEDEKNTLLELSDIVYRRCKSRGITSIGLAGIHDKEGIMIGFVGCVAYDNKQMDLENLKACVHEVENIYELI